MNVPATELKIPPVPEVRAHVPPPCSPDIRVKRSIRAVEVWHTDVLPSVPALGWLFIFTVAILLWFIHGAAPEMV
jgi:hypothetical protein